MTFSFHQGGVVMSSQIMHTQLSTMHIAHLSPYTKHLHCDVCCCAFYSLPQLHHIMASHPSPGDKAIRMWESGLKELGYQSKIAV